MKNIELVEIEDNKGNKVYWHLDKLQFQQKNKSQKEYYLFGEINSTLKIDKSSRGN